MQEKKFMTVQEAAVYLDKSPYTIRSAVRRGLLAYTREEYGRKLIAVSDLDTYSDTAKRGRPKKDDQSG